MDGSKFDVLSRSVRAAGTRRFALRSAFGGLVGSAVAAVGLAAMAEEAEAKKKKKKKKNCPICRPLPSTAICSRNAQCCTNETNLACAVPAAAGNSDKHCCGATGAPCTGTGASTCCADFACTSGTCQPVFSPV